MFSLSTMKVRVRWIHGDRHSERFVCRLTEFARGFWTKAFASNYGSELLPANKVSTEDSETLPYTFIPGGNGSVVNL
jgi:hypothetical protein